MKFNLKNRPAFTRRRYPKGTCAPDIEEMLDWFEGFEKELREKLSALEKINERRKYGSEIWEIPAKIELLKEILGDEHK